MDKVDFKNTLKRLYQPSSKEFAIVDVPEMQFLMIDGKGDPGTSQVYADAVGWLYAVSYPVKFLSKSELGRDFVVPPLEGLWWADDVGAFAAGDRDSWRWTMMIMQPNWISDSLFKAGMNKAGPNSAINRKRYG